MSNLSLLIAGFFYGKNNFAIMKKVVLILIACFLVQTANSQSYTFKVLANQGQNKVKSSDSKWEYLKTGTRLNKGDKLKITSNGYLGLVHSSGKTLELTESGSFDVGTLSDKIVSNSTSIVSKYADYVISKMAPEKIEQNRRKYASVTGSVERGEDDSDILLFVPKNGKLLNSKASLIWEYGGDDSEYVVSIKNIFGDQILTTEVSMPFYSVDFKNDKIAEGSIMNFIIVKVELKNDSSVASQEVAISLLDGEEELEAKKILSELVSSLGKNSSLNNLILAEFYEEQGLILDAITSYENALILSPDVDYFQEVYDEFLIRNGLKPIAYVD